jgi:hypothetical protein
MTTPDVPIVDITTDEDFIQHVRDYHTFARPDGSILADDATRGFHAFLHHHDKKWNHTHPEEQVAL